MLDLLNARGLCTCTCSNKAGNQVQKTIIHIGGGTYVQHDTMLDRREEQRSQGGVSSESPQFSSVQLAMAGHTTGPCHSVVTGVL